MTESYNIGLVNLEIFNMIIGHTHTHIRFTALLDFVQDYKGELATER